jgi:hypothetical protein
MVRKPLTKQRSAWAHIGPMAHLNVYERRVGDGRLRVLVGIEPLGWHMSISFTNHNGVLTRYPTWDEIADARDWLLPDDIGFVMHLPPADEYVALHDTTFHLHEFPERD